MRRVEAVKTENANRRAAVRLVIRAEPLATAERRGSSP